MRRFAGIDLGREPVPDETAVLSFRHLLAAHGARLFVLIGQYLEENGLKVGTGTSVGGSIIHAPGSTKNREKKRDPERPQARKGDRWYLGMKARIGVEHPFLVIKRIFGFSKVRYRGVVQGSVPKSGVIRGGLAASVGLRKLEVERPSPATEKRRDDRRRDGSYRSR